MVSSKYSIGILILLFSPVLRAENKCDEEFLKYCRKVVLVYEVKKPFQLFHWFSTKHYGGATTADAHIRKTLDSFLQPQTFSSETDSAGTRGLYMATDPVMSCSYGGPVTKDQKPLLAVADIPAGARVAYVPLSARFNFNGSSDCRPFYESWTLLAKKCFEGKSVTLYAYRWDENGVVGKERDLFGKETVAFTGGQPLKYKIFDWKTLNKSQDMVPAVIRDAIHSTGAAWCKNYLELLPMDNSDEETKKKIRLWQENNFLVHQGSREVFSPMPPSSASPAKGSPEESH